MDKIPGKVFLVGGAVRDSLLGLAVEERDWVVVGATTSAMETAGYRKVGKDFPVFLHPDTNEEFALARQERKVSAGHLGFETKADETVSLEEDLARRDLTINAIAQDDSGQIRDPYGGQKDIEDRLLRHVTAAFSEDPLRVLRVARFAARFHSFGFSVVPETLELMRCISASGELSSLPPERVWRETEKALGTDNPRIFFELLRECGALAQLFPEIDALFGVEQRADYHPEIDAGLHTMLSLDQICSITQDKPTRFATLVHDLGKAVTPKEILPSHRGHEERGVDLVEAMCDRLKVPNQYRSIALRVTRHHLKCHRALELKPSTLEKLLGQLDAWRTDDYLIGFVKSCMADARGRTGLESRPYPQHDFLLECAREAKDVDTSKLREQGFEGKELGEKIRRVRVEILARVKTAYSHIDERKYARS